MMLELHPKALAMLNEKFNILYATDCRDVDLDLDKLSASIDRHNKEVFSPKDRFLFVHMDTDYYDPLLPCGLFVTNLLRIFESKYIPLFPILFVTNHMGIKKEFDLLLKDHDPTDRPTIVETLLSPILLSDNFELQDDVEFDSIEKPGICMMGQRRSHRVALCSFFKRENLLANVALQTNFR